MFDHHRTLKLQEPGLQGEILEEDDEAIQLYNQLMDGEWVVLDMQASQELTWNGFRLVVLPGENIVPLAFWVLWQQTQIDIADGEKNLARDIDASMQRNIRRRPLRFARDYVLRPYNKESERFFAQPPKELNDAP